MTTTPQVRLAALYRNSPARGSGKTGRKSLVLAAQVARQLGMVPTWPNVQTIRLAIESEAELSSASLAAAADVIVKAAKEQSLFSPYVPPSKWQERELFRENSVDRFWFEDARWRSKNAYVYFRALLNREEWALRLQADLAAQECA